MDHAVNISHEEGVGVLVLQLKCILLLQKEKLKTVYLREPIGRCTSKIYL